MSGITAKLFDFFINLQTVIVFGGLAYLLYATDTLANPFTSESVAAWIVAFFFFILYVGFVGQFVVANHTRELTEQQVELLLPFANVWVVQKEFLRLSVQQPAHEPFTVVCIELWDSQSGHI